jgi:pyruvate dehydrogenase E2 component (dihydrolipoamide acetyltransferase)
MATKNIALPELGEGVTEGELVKFTVKVGDRIKADQTIAEMMTDKATVEVPSPAAGVVKELRAKDGDVVTVGQVLIVIDDAPGAAVGVGATNGVAASNGAAKPAATVSGAANATASPAAAKTSGGGGMKDVALPELGEGVTEGELVKFTVKVGDTVKQDQTIAEMMTDKATVEVPSPFAGVVKTLRAKVGDVITVGQVLIQLESSAGAAATNATTTATATQAPRPQASVPASSRSTAPAMMSASGSNVPAAGGFAGGMNIHPPVADSKVLATPATRRLAREMGVDINGLNGSGVAGRVTRDDVMKTGAGAVSAGAPTYQAPGLVARAAYQGPPGALEERVAIRGIRKKIAESMQLAKQIIPHVTLMDEANITSLVKLREDLKASGEKAGVKITYLPFVMKALIATLREFPAFNASIDDKAQEIVYKKYFNIGFAADTPNGLVVPVIKNADQKSILQLSREINELAKKARDGKLALDEMRGATITITNIGSIGSTYATPIINLPEVAIIGMYKIQDKPLIKMGAGGKYEIDLAKVMNYTVTADHRLLDGAMIANFLKAMIARLENPGVLMLDMM